ncbi:MAG: Sun protein [Verrucomicrobiales bacterium]|nr:Sun protein [Verrucomicrobiales bacterium]
MAVQKPREIAARILLRRLEGEDFVENILDDELARANLSPPDRGLCQEIVYGVVRWQATLDWLIARKTQKRAQHAPLHILLQLGLYQMLWLERIPDHAAVHETVELGRKMGFNSQSGFLNAVLRAYTREKEATKTLLQEMKVKDPAIGYSQPQWLVEKWKTRFGVEKTSQLLEWNNTPPKTYARVNSLKTNAEDLARQWTDEGVKFIARDFPWTEAKLVFELESHPSIATLPSFQQGFFYIQDPSTLLSVYELNPQREETVLDFCAAPGGKTTFIAQLMQNRGKIVAQDVRARLGLIRENYIRLGVVCADAVAVPETFNGSDSPTASRQFDRILVDSPCSNTGVLRRRVDLRWRLRRDEMVRLRETQLQILRQSAARLKSGGTLVYSTCSLEPEENSGVVKAFLSEHPQFNLERERELLPFDDGVDGAYVAKLILAK